MPLCNYLQLYVSLGSSHERYLYSNLSDQIKNMNNFFFFKTKGSVCTDFILHMVICGWLVSGTECGCFHNLKRFQFSFLLDKFYLSQDKLFKIQSFTEGCISNTILHNLTSNYSNASCNSV